VVDTLLAKHGHAVLRDPPYHCEYNPIEFIWSVSKRIYSKLIRKYKGSVSVQQSVATWEQALSNVDPSAWFNTVEHCDKLVMSHYAAVFGDKQPANNTDRIIVSLNSSDSDSDVSDDEYQMRLIRRQDHEKKQVEKRRKDEERREKLLEEVNFDRQIA
jgi:hypothetical protein